MGSRHGLSKAAGRGRVAMLQGFKVNPRKLEHGFRRIGARIPYTLPYGCSNFLASTIGALGLGVSGFGLKGLELGLGIRAASDATVLGARVTSPGIQLGGQGFSFGSRISGWVWLGPGECRWRGLVAVDTVSSGLRSLGRHGNPVNTVDDINPAVPIIRNIPIPIVSRGSLR